MYPSRRSRSLPGRYSLSSGQIYRERAFTVGKFLVIAVAAIVLFIAVFTVGKDVTDDNYARAVSALQDEGYTNITLERTYWMSGCGKEDYISYLAHATNIRGKRVELIVCMGYWKGVTIRHR